MAEQRPINNIIRLVKSLNVKRKEEKDKAKNILELDKDDALKLIAKGGMHCEIFKDLDCNVKLYLDLERDDYKEEVSAEIKQQILEAALEKINSSLNIDGFDSKKNVAIAQRHRFVTKRGKTTYKVSFRFFVNCISIKHGNIPFFMECCGLDEKIPVIDVSFDDKIYDTNRCLNCIYNCKKIDEMDFPLMPISDHPIEDFVAQYLKGDELYCELDEAKRQEQERKKQTQKPKVKGNSEEDYKEALSLIQLLSDERANDYKEWTNVCWCLRNIDDRLYEEFLDFSKKSYKYDEYACEKYWNSEKKNGKQFTMGSLKYWAKKDSPELYASMSKDKLWSLISKSKTGTEYDVAIVVQHMYRDEFVFDAGQKTWFQFKNHKWNSITNAYTLQLKLPTEVADTYRSYASYYQAKASSPDIEIEEKERLDQVVISINKIVTSLKKVSFQVSVLSQCALLFAQEKIVENMDEKRNLLCFNNGVYDLDIDEFRDGRPDDWITYSVGYDYDKNVNDEIQDRIWDFLISIQDTPENASFLTTTMGMMAHGEKKRDTFIIWRGEGGNGKGVLSLLLKGAFGQYYEAPDISLYTTKKTSSSSASSELVKCKAKRCICSSEAEEGSTIQVAFIKSITGEDDVTCRALYKEPISFKFQAYPLIMTNPKPALSGVDGGVTRRMIMIPFNNNFVEDPVRPNERLIDLSIRKEFKEVEFYQQFMLILIRAYQEYRDSGFVLRIPENVRKETDEYFNDNNHIYNFINDTYEIAPKEMKRIDEFEENNFRVLSDTVKRDFKEWCKKEGVIHTMRPADFFKAVMKELTGMNRFCEKTKCKTGAWRDKHAIYGIKPMLDTFYNNGCQIQDDYD